MRVAAEQGRQTVGHVAAAHAAAERRRRIEHEEEEMSFYGADEVGQEWEFKIVRSARNDFRRPETFQRLLEEEAAAGWQLLEKLDDGRVRLKRPAAARSGDAALPPGIDPYRTQFGWSPEQVGVLAAMVGISVAILIFGVVMVASGAADAGPFGPRADELPVLVVIVALAVLVVVVGVLKLRRR